MALQPPSCPRMGGGRPGWWERMSRTRASHSISAVMEPSSISAAREIVDEIYMDAKIKDYIIDLVFATREPGSSKGTQGVAGLIQFGASPRASINVNLAAKAVAYIDGRDYVLPEDIKEVAVDVMGHRVILNYEAEADNVKTSSVIKTILSKIPINK